MTAHDLAVGWVEAHTEYDFHPLPAHVKDALLSAAEVFLEFAYPRVVVARESRPELSA